MIDPAVMRANKSCVGARPHDPNRAKATDERDLVRIILRDVRIENANVGVYTHERERAQPVGVNITMWVPRLPAAHSEKVSDTVDYAAVVQTITKTVKLRHYALLESLCDTLVTTIMQAYPVHHLAVEVSKPWALGSAYVSVAMERSRA